MPSTRYALLRVDAVKRGLSMGLTREQHDAFWGKPCHYCGAQIDTVGLDRTDPYGGYEPGNVVPCCWLCNVWKASLTVEQFRIHLERLYRIQVIGESVPPAPYRVPSMRKQRLGSPTQHPDRLLPPPRGRGALRRYDVQQIREALQDARGNTSLAAQRLGCARETVWRYVLRYPELDAVLEAGRAEWRRRNEPLTTAARPPRVIDRGQQGETVGRPRGARNRNTQGR